MSVTNLPSLQRTTEVGATSNKQVSLKNATVNTAALVLDVTSSAGTGIVLDLKVDSTTQLMYELIFGAFYGFAQPNESSNIFFGMSSTSAYILVSSATIAMGGTLNAAGITCSSLTDSGLTSGRYPQIGTSGLFQDSADATYSGTASTFTKLKVKQGGSSSTANVGGTTFDHFADANNGTTVETDIFSDTQPASLFATNGDKVEGHYCGVFVGDATSTQRVRAYFGGTLIFDTGALGVGITAASWVLNIVCIRVSSSVVRCSAALNTSFATLNSYATYTEVTGLTLTNTQILKVTGTAAGATGGSNQITGKFSRTFFEPAA